MQEGDNLVPMASNATRIKSVYGFIKGNIALPIIDARLADSNPSATLKTELLGLPVGAKLSDGVKTLTVTSSTAAIDLTGWNLAKLNLSVFDAGVKTFNVTVRSTTSESVYGSSASTSKTVQVQMLSGTACANPVGVNPCVNYVNNTTVVTSSFGNSVGSNLVVSTLVASSSNYNFGISNAQTLASVHADPSESDASMEAWLQGLDKSISATLMKEMMQAFGGGV